VSGAGSKKWNGCYDRSEAGGSVLGYILGGTNSEYPGFGCLSLHNDVKLNDATLEECKQACNARDTCKSVDFYEGRTGHTCSLSDSSFADVGTTTSTSDCRFYEKKGGGNYKHRAHTGTIYQYEGTWRIAVSGQYTSYQAPTIRSSVVPTSGWVAGLDSRTPDGLGDAPAPDLVAVFS